MDPQEAASNAASARAHPVREQHIYRFLRQTLGETQSGSRQETMRDSAMPTDAASDARASRSLWPLHKGQNLWPQSVDHHSTRMRFLSHLGKMQGRFPRRATP